MFCTEAKYKHQINSDVIWLLEKIVIFETFLIFFHISVFFSTQKVCAIVIANMHIKSSRSANAAANNGQSAHKSNNNNANTNVPDPVESILNRANNWCARERIKHYTVNAMERASLYEPFIGLAARLHPAQTKTSFPQLRQLTQKTSKMDN